MRIAIIDLGTNTFNLLIRDTKDHEVIFMTKRSVRLGEGGITNKTISDPALIRALDTLEEYKPLETYAFATSAVRDAENRDRLINEARIKYGILINVIDGDTEAELIFQGVAGAMDLSESVSLIMDIGGGSTEFIFTKENKAVWKKSYQLGSSRFLQMFSPSDPIEEIEIENIQKHLSTEIADLIEAQKSLGASCLIGSSGSFETLAAMIMAEFHNDDGDPENGYDFEVSEYGFIANKMLTSNLEERLNTPGMIPMRADMIVMAVILINYIRHTLGIEQMKLSNYALKEGVYHSVNQSNSKWLRSLL